MNISFLKRLLLFLGLLVAQVLVLNHIHLFGYAVPLLYIYFVISFQRNYPRWAILVWSFLLGLGIDVSSNTPGLAAASMTLMGLLQPYVLELFMQRDSNDDMQPAIFSFGPYALPELRGHPHGWLLPRILHVGVVHLLQLAPLAAELHVEYGADVAVDHGYRQFEKTIIRPCLAMRQGIGVEE